MWQGAGLVTHVVQSGGSSNEQRGHRTNRSAHTERIIRRDTDRAVCDTGEEEGGEGTMDEGSGRTVELGEEDEEKGKGSRLGKVGVCSDGPLELGLINGVGSSSLVLGVTDRASLAIAEHDARLHTQGNHIGGQVLWTKAQDKPWMSVNCTAIAAKQGRTE